MDTLLWVLAGVAIGIAALTLWAFWGYSTIEWEEDDWHMTATQKKGKQTVTATTEITLRKERSDKGKTRKPYAKRSAK